MLSGSPVVDDMGWEALLAEALEVGGMGWEAMFADTPELNITG